ncbi:MULTISPECIES: hypothetical protein [Achromobacter]|uniref:Uncharacterized protein n=1 Tax=Achromobacter mucicolens TaxID=1389922 RepID=A0ABM8LK09_9BURK|nr:MULTISPECIES: hypothetical protein [Achromobacter]AVG44139.1 hypothetical protein MC81_32180 [Achromobacter insolitus]CAB3847141.1 hypothetical protein LMG3410_01576 [Achromobacter aegrifaciens]CAB3912934.1 hypothetical protein LMG3415_05072 [Achromobacter mucicolens]
MNLYTFQQLGENLPDLQAEGRTVYEGVRAISDRINGGAVHKFGHDHYAISTHEGTGLCQLLLKSTAVV